MAIQRVYQRSPSQPTRLSLLQHRTITLFESGKSTTLSLPERTSEAKEEAIVVFVY